MAPAPTSPADDGNKEDNSENQKAPNAVARKIIQNATIRIESSDSRKSREQATQITEQSGGYVASSSEYQNSDGTTNVSMTLKVPSEKLNEILTALRATGTRVSSESISSQDVSAEFYDLESRIKAQRAIEAQFLVIAREAKTVQDLLAVQQKLGEVRSEIERMEGRRNQLSHLTSLATIQLTFSSSRDSTSLAATVGSAGRDARNIFSALFHGSIRFVGIFLPIVLFFGPFGLGLALLIRKIHRRAHPPHPTAE